MSEAMLKAIVLAPKFTGGLSMVGSSLICWDILKDRGGKLRKVYHRLLFVMSLMDIFLSFTLFLSTWPIPKDQPNAPWLAAGNDATCTAQAFAQVFFMPALFYNAYLSIYYVLVIVYNWPEHKIAPLEKYVHGFTFLFSCITAFTALALDLYGSNFTVWCFIKGSWNVQLAMNIGWQWAAFIIVFICMGFLIWKIGKQYRTLKKYGAASIQARMEEETQNPRSSWLNRGSMTRLSWRRKSDIKNPMASVKTQAALYCMSFLLSESSNVAVTIAYYSNEGHVVPAWVLLYALIVLPLQGFWNCLIYYRPRYLEYRKALKKKRQSLKNDEVSTEKLTDNPYLGMGNSSRLGSSRLYQNNDTPTTPEVARSKRTSKVMFMEVERPESSEAPEDSFQKIVASVTTAVMFPDEADVAREAPVLAGEERWATNVESNEEETTVITSSHDTQEFHSEQSHSSDDSSGLASESADSPAAFLTFSASEESQQSYSNDYLQEIAATATTAEIPTAVLMAAEQAPVLSVKDSHERCAGVIHDEQGDITSSQDMQGFVGAQDMLVSSPSVESSFWNNRNSYSSASSTNSKVPAGLQQDSSDCDESVRSAEATRLVAVASEALTKSPNVRPDRARTLRMNGEFLSREFLPLGIPLGGDAPGHMQTDKGDGAFNFRLESFQDQEEEQVREERLTNAPRLGISVASQKSHGRDESDVEFNALHYVAGATVAIENACCSPPNPV